MKQKKLIFNFLVNRNWKKLTDSRKRAKILADNRKSHHPIETLYIRVLGLPDGQPSNNEQRALGTRMSGPGVVKGKQGKWRTKRSGNFLSFVRGPVLVLHWSSLSFCPAVGDTQYW